MFQRANKRRLHHTHTHPVVVKTAKDVLKYNKKAFSFHLVWWPATGKLHCWEQLTSDNLSWFSIKIRGTPAAGELSVICNCFSRAQPSAAPKKQQQRPETKNTHKNHAYIKNNCTTNRDRNDLTYLNQVGLILSLIYYFFSDCMNTNFCMNISFLDSGTANSLLGSVFELTRQCVKYSAWQIVKWGDRH